MTTLMSPAAERLTLQARWVFPADAPPIPGGLVTIHGETIEAVEPAGTRTADVDLGNVAVLPGLVNAHTHLDLSDARDKIPPTTDFTDWLRRVIAHRREQSEEQAKNAVAAGIAESLAHGVTLLGDIAAGPASCRLLRHAPIRGVIFLELIGLKRDRIVESVERAQGWLKEIPREQTHEVIPWGNLDILGATNDAPAWWTPHTTVRTGISPHAPYSVNTWAFWLASAWNRHTGIPVAVHLAESPHEAELLATASGPFVGLLEDLGAWEPHLLAPSWEWIVRLFEGGQSVLWIHANYLPVDLVEPAGHVAQDSVPVRPGHTVVYCPRTHAAFGHPPHPFREFLQRRVRVALGTDSLASNPDLDVLAEARYVAARHPDLPGETLLRMITLAGAEALGWADVAGSLTPGKSADLVVLPLADRDETDPHRLVFDSSAAVEQVMFRGAWVSQMFHSDTDH